MQFDIVTIFPEFFDSPFRYGIVRRAHESGLLAIRVVDLRDFTGDRHRTVDDRPFGGGAGMVLKPEPLFAAVEKLQCFLNEYAPGGEPLEIDGHFGPKTEDRLREFQTKHGIGVDGIVGVETMDAMADVVLRGLMVDERFCGLPDELQRSALNLIEGTSSSQNKRVLAETLMTGGLAEALRYARKLEEPKHIE